jgi:hypothetical protein
MVTAVESEFGLPDKKIREYDSQFKGRKGNEFKKLIIWASSRVGINPGLLAANALAETNRNTYLSKNKVNSYFGPGVDDFYQERGRIGKKVPAIEDIRWDKTTVVTHYNDAKKKRLVKSIWFNTGKDALLANAVYLKYHEEFLRDAAKRAHKSFDSLSLETRFALTRYAVRSGVGNGKVRLLEALKGSDILVRRPGKLDSKRAATIHTVQAIHLSKNIFRISLQPRPPQPRLRPQPRPRPIVTPRPRPMRRGKKTLDDFNPNFITKTRKEKTKVNMT